MKNCANLISRQIISLIKTYMPMISRLYYHALERKLQSEEIEFHAQEAKK